MKQQQTMKTETIPFYHLRLVKGLNDTQTETTDLVSAAWNFAYSALWNATQFSSKEIETAKEKIYEYLHLAKNPRKAFLTFCQRVLLARQYVNSGKGRYIPLPSIWLDKEYEKGFAGTKEWFQEIKIVRQSLPNYKSEIKALAEAVLEYTEEPTVQNFLYWRNYFMEKEAPGLLNLFQVSIINQHFNLA